MQNEVIAALPAGQKANSPLLRNFLIKRIIYTFAPTDNPQTFYALDAETGALPQALAFNERIFWIDPNDSTSAHDGVAVIRTADDYRYKVNAIDNRTLSVRNWTTTTPPVSPQLGDTYLVPAGATGPWAPHQDDIATWGRNGWAYEIPRIGRWLLDEAVKGYLSYGPTGWTYGPGARSFDAASIPFSASMGWGARFEVENFTSTAPPTATKGRRFVVASPATGAWTGKEKQIAFCEVAGSWVYYQPQNGWTAYDQSSNTEFRYNGSDWISAGGSWVDRKSVQTTSGLTTAATGSTGYSYSSGTAPTTSQRRIIDTATITHTAKKTGAVLRFKYTASALFALNSATFTAAAGPHVIALFRDVVVNAVDWRPLQGTMRDNMNLGGTTLEQGVDAVFEIPAPDALSHTYRIVILSVGIGNQPLDVTALTRRLFTLEEAS